ncbi:polyprenyl synthetase family protein [Tautonia plasticadhaerens]|uniref:Heptaprenyl diphosphate synthase component 2 n=1 Tax=Tautonia plasticadhaerens TaxID=2527974 RepID=A0A518HBC4_9BACT|nr:polyprenyl synthetase family protein [Tautonia plasticadhaerens]QDV38016.1 Heptaprenyl diphosphate synthase component 2 [Tautonia plasticadhaerens]
MIEVARPAPVLDRLAPGRDRDRIDLYLNAFLAESRRRHLGNAHLEPLYEQVCGAVLRGGKRIRPRICLASYRIVSGEDEVPPRPAWLAASSLEIFHAFMLVHDDLIDGSLLRRDRDTLHEALRRGHDRPESDRARKLGSDLGLIGGDLLFALGMRMVSRAGIDPKVAPGVHRLLSDMLLETGLGEALDVLYDDCPLERITEAQIIEAYLRKTARYSISGPLVLGAMLAEAPRAVCRALDRFGDLLGLGYQIRNDLDALAVGPDEGDHPDLDGGKRTIVLWDAHRLLTASGRRELARLLDEGPGIGRRRRLHALIHESGAIEASEDRLRSLQEEAHSALVESPLDPMQRRSLLALIDLLPGGVPTSAAGVGRD